MLRLILSFSLRLLQLLFFSITKMENSKFDRHDRDPREATRNLCLANTLDEPYPSLAQKPTISLSPRKTFEPEEPFTHLRAVNVLLDQKDDDIVAYIRFARSLHHHQNLFDPLGYGSLSADQVQAIWTLKDYPHVNRTWLKETRELGKIGEHLLDIWKLI